METKEQKIERLKKEIKKDKKFFKSLLNMNIEENLIEKWKYRILQAEQELKETEEEF